MRRRSNKPNDEHEEDVDGDNTIHMHHTQNGRGQFTKHYETSARRCA